MSPTRIIKKIVCVIISILWRSDGEFSFLMIDILDYISMF